MSGNDDLFGAGAAPRSGASSQGSSADNKPTSKAPSKSSPAPVGGTPGEFGAFIKAELAKWAQVVKVSGAKAE